MTGPRSRKAAVPNSGTVPEAPASSSADDEFVRGPGTMHIMRTFAFLIVFILMVIVLTAGIILQYEPLILGAGIIGTVSVVAAIWSALQVSYGAVPAAKKKAE